MYTYILCMYTVHTYKICMYTYIYTHTILIHIHTYIHTVSTGWEYQGSGRSSSDNFVACHRRSQPTSCGHQNIVRRKICMYVLYSMLIACMYCINILVYVCVCMCWTPKILPTPKCMYVCVAMRVLLCLSIQCHEDMTIYPICWHHITVISLLTYIIICQRPDRAAQRRSEVCVLRSLQTMVRKPTLPLSIYIHTYVQKTQYIHIYSYMRTYILNFCIYVYV